MALNLDRQIGPVKVKDILGGLGLVGDATAAYTLFSGRLAMIIGVLSLALLLIWGLLSKDSARPFIRVLARVTAFVAAAVLAVAAMTGTFMLVSEPPPALGDVTHVEVEEFILTGERPANHISGPFSPKLTRSADVAEVGITAAPGDDRRVEGIKVVSVGGSEEDTGRMREVYNKRSPLQVYYEVDGPTPEFKVVLHIDARLNQPGTSPTLKMRAHYTYARRDWSWRLRRWIFENIGERLR